MPDINRHFARFAAAGVVNTALDWGTYYLASRHIFHSDASTEAKVLGVIVGITSAFLLNSFWVFNDRFLPELRRQASPIRKLYFFVFYYIRFIAVYLLGMALNVVSFHAAIVIGVHELAALALATAVSMTINFAFLRFWLYRGRITDRLMSQLI